MLDKEKSVLVIKCTNCAPAAFVFSLLLFEMKGGRSGERRETAAAERESIAFSPRSFPEIARVNPARARARARRLPDRPGGGKAQERRRISLFSCHHLQSCADPIPPLSLSLRHSRFLKDSLGAAPFRKRKRNCRSFRAAPLHLPSTWVAAAATPAGVEHAEK